MNKVPLILSLMLAGCGQPVSAGKGTPTQGPAGFNSLVSITRQSTVTGCENSGIILATGLDLNRNSLLEPDEIKIVTFLCDGTDGTNGSDGTNAPQSSFDIVNIITPCGKKAGIFNESLLELANGDILDYFEHGSNRFLNILTPGGYQTSDSKNCRFSIREDGKYYE